MRVSDAETPLNVLVGRATLERIFSEFEEPVNDLGPVDTRHNS
ncbi:hypothetical protein LINGRAHAP2_LOCUS33213 [Linum grandiflorum]